jgi:hypothetical protein
VGRLAGAASRTAVRSIALASIAAASALTISGCGNDGDPPDESEGSGTASATAEEDLGVGALYFGECGSVSTEEFAQVTGLGTLELVERNSVGCRWESVTGDGGHGSFSWYRGSPILRERTLVERSGRFVEDITMGSMSGYVGWTSGLCEVGLSSGEDFFVWSVLYPSGGTGAMICDPVKALAQLTVDRAQ